MAVSSLTIDAFLEAAKSAPVLDVRSPGEYSHAHIPGAHSLPLFTDAERAVIGTAYKHESREQAIKIGLDAFGPKMRAMVETAEGICAAKNTRRVLVHCWRGGMRSQAVSWLLDLYGFEVCLLEGGYKAYRRWAIAHWEQPMRFRVVAGNTGTGKTEILHLLEQSGAPVLDLEALACHKGSAFGALPGVRQPSQEMFENRLATRLHELSTRFPEMPVWVEDESQRIGDLNMPAPFFRKLAQMPKYYLYLPFEARLDRIVQEYGSLPTEQLVNNMIRIKKRLGPLETKTALSLLIEGDIRGCFAILLRYYDKRYYPAAPPGAHTLDCTGRTPHQILSLLNELSI